MSTNYGKVRKSQFIFSLGPGSFFEDPVLGTGIIKELTSENFYRTNHDGTPVYTFRDFKLEDNGTIKQLVSNYIEHQTTEPAVINKDRINFFEIPGYEDESGRNIFGFKVEAFPDWKLCLKCGILYKTSKCPKCGKKGNPKFRIVSVCPNGHLDNIWLEYLVHLDSKRKNCDFAPASANSNNVYFKWEGEGTAASQIKITCPKCGASITLGKLMKTEYPCSKRYPEKIRNQYSPVCDAKMKPILIHASNIKLNEVITVFTVKPAYTYSSNKILENSKCITSLLRLINRNIKDENTCQDFLSFLLEGDCKPIAEEIIKEINDRGCIKFLAWLKKKNDEKKAIEELSQIEKECLTFLEGSKKGIPPTDEKKSTPLIEINKAKKFSLNGLIFQAVDLLTVYHILLGYRRLDPANKLVLTYGITDNGDYWFPAIKNSGEGIFIYPSPKLIQVVERIGKKSETLRRLRELILNGNHKQKIPRDPLNRDSYFSDPLFIFLHTLSHILIKYFGTVTGYSSASLRERIYICNHNGQKSGGILIYTSSEDADGSMGGLISFVQNLRNNTHLRQKFSKQLEELIRYCSNDPLCIEQKFDERTLSGAACYVCSLVSETSCEFQNKLLDRKLVLDVLNNFNFL
jgi:endogenous inhibitor of DNA gyrase (YacG/DUF329 family)